MSQDWEQTSHYRTLGVYESNQIDLLRDVFVWAYERSCQRYLAITQTMAEPDPLRIQYREQLINSVQTIVRGYKMASTDTIEQLANDLIPKQDREAFCKMLMDTMHRLHEGNVARYRFKLSEYQEWKQSLE